MITFDFITLVDGAGIGGAILPIPFLLLEEDRRKLTVECGFMNWKTQFTLRP